MPTTISNRALSCLPVFPLPRLVLFPGTRLPLRVFEPAHCAMLRACIEQPKPWMVITQLKPLQEEGAEPAFFRVGGLAYVRSHQEHGDGSLEVEVAATARVHLTRLPQEGLDYTRGSGLLLPDGSNRDGQVAQSELSSLLSIAWHIARLLQGMQPDFQVQLPRGGSGPGAIADQVADQLVLNPMTRQAILETLDVPTRIRCVIDHLAKLQLALAGAGDSPLSKSQAH